MSELLKWQSATPKPTAEQLNDPEWERKQRNREYRVAARREKRNRKADEKKQRKLNATILRRMTRNPEKYSKNSERNKSRAIDVERRAIWLEAIKQAERLAAKHDPSGKLFNVGPVVTQDDGSVVSVEVLKRREERQKEKEAKAAAELAAEDREAERQRLALERLPANMPIPKDVDPEKYKMIAAQNQQAPRREGISKSQQKKLEKYAPKPTPPKPVLPDGVAIAENETNWIALWDITDAELERRLQREKKKKQMDRKALRNKQQAGKLERRAARDEKRRVYRDLKETWKQIKAREKKHKTMMKSEEDHEAKAIAVELNTFQRRVAMAVCGDLGFTLENTEGVQDIVPIVRGLKGKSIDWDNLEIGKGTDIQLKGQKSAYSAASNRVDLSKAAGEGSLHYIGGGNNMEIDDIGFAGDDDGNEEDDDEDDDLAANQDMLKLDVGDDQAHENVNFNHRTRRKIRRALDNQQIQREVLVREKAIKYLEEQGLPVPSILRSSPKPVHEKGARLLENGSLETEKQERIRQRIELTEFNNNAKVLRRQAKEIALEAGLRVYAEMTGRIAKPEGPVKEAWEVGFGEGWLKPPKPDTDDVLWARKKALEASMAQNGDAMDVDEEEESDGGFTLHGVRF